MILAAGMLGGADAAAQRALLWDNGEWDGLGNTSSERHTLVPESWVVDDIVLNDPVIVREFSWVCAMSPELEPIATDLIILTEDLVPITEMFDLGYTRVFGGMAFGDYEIYEVTLTGLEIVLDPGHYYIGGRMVGDGAGRSVALLQGAVHGETAPFFRSEFFGYPDWVPLGDIYFERDAVFKVYGDVVPIPATLAVLLPGLFVARRWR